MAVGSYVTPDNVRDIFAGTDVCLTDGRIERACQRANDFIENVTQRILISQNYVDEVPLLINRFSEVVVKVRQWPITAVSALSITLSGTLQPTVLDPAYVDFKIPPERLFYYRSSYAPATSQGLGINSLSIGRFARGVVTYSYTAGFNPIPGDITLAGILMTQHYIMRDANPMGAMSISVSAEGSSNSISFAAKSMNQTEAEEILSKYVRRES